MKKICSILCVALLMVVLSACGGDQTLSPDDSPPTKAEEPDTNNPFLLAEFSIDAVLSGDKKVIGTRGYINVKKEDVPDFFSAEFSQYMAEFVDKKVKHSPHNCVSIIFDDRTGFTFAGSNSLVADYGPVDLEGGIIKAMGSCQKSPETGAFEYIDYNIREIPNPNLMQQALAPENSFRPAPEEIFSTTAEENGYSGSAYYAEGKIVSRFDFRGFDTIQVATDTGSLYISDILVNLPDVSVDDHITVFFIYTGWTSVRDAPCGAYVYSECENTVTSETPPDAQQAQISTVSFEEYKTMVSDFSSRIMEESAILANAGMYEHSYWKAYSSLPTDGDLDYQDMAEAAMEWLSESSDADAETVKAAYDELIVASINISDANIDGEIPEELPELVQALFGAYHALYSLVVEPSGEIGDFLIQLNNHVNAIMAFNEDISALIEEA